MAAPLGVDLMAKSANPPQKPVPGTPSDGTVVGSAQTQIIDPIIDEIDALEAYYDDQLAQQQSEIDALSQQGTPTRQPSGAQLVGGTIPAGSAFLQEVGDGHDRWVAASVVLDNTKRGAWAAQAVANPYALPIITSSNTLTTGTNGTAGYSFTFGATIDLGGGDYAWSIASGGTDATHVAGLSLNTTTGALTGTPSSAGTFLFVIEVIDEIGGFTTQVCTLTIAATSTPTFVVPGVPSVEPAVNVAWSFDPTPYLANLTTGTGIVWSSASLPVHHLSINSSTGLVTGTPLTADGGHSFTIAFTVTNGTTTLHSSMSVSIPATGAVNITTVTLPSMQQSQPITTTTLATSGATGTVTFAVTAGTLPTGLALSSAGVLSGTPSVTGAYDFTVTASDSGTATTDVQQYTGNIAAAAAAFSWFGGAASFDLGTLFPANRPKVGDTVAIALPQFALNPGGAVIFDSGSPATTPVDKLDVASGVYGGVPTIATTVNPKLRASNDGGSTWKSTQCHLQVYSTTPSTNIDTAITNAGGQIDAATGALTGSSGRTKGATNLAALISAINAAKSAGNQLATSAGSYANPIFIGLSRSAFGQFFSIGSSGTPWATGVSLDGVIFYLVDGQPTDTGGAALQFMTLYPANGIDWALRVDIRGGSQAAPPAADSGAQGFYNHGILVKSSANTNYLAEVYNCVGVTGSSKNGTEETFPMKFGADGGGHSGSCTMKNKWEGDTGTHFASGMVVQQTPETAGAHAPRGWVTLIADWQRHAFGEYAGGPWGIDNGSLASNCGRGFYVEAGAPANPGVQIPSPSLYIGRPGTSANPPTTTNCGNVNSTTGAVGTNASGGNEPGELIVNSHTSTSDIYAPYVTQGTTATPPSFTIANSTITGAPACCIRGLGGVHSAEQNLQKVSVDHASCTVAGLGGNPQVKGGTSGTVGSGSWA